MMLGRWTITFTDAERAARGRPVRQDARAIQDEVRAPVRAPVPAGAERRRVWVEDREHALAARRASGTEEQR